MLLLIISATVLVAHFATPVSGQPTIHTISATTAITTIHTISATTEVTTSSVSNSTQLLVTLAFPNGTKLTNGSLYAGTIPANYTSGQFEFQGLGPGNYQLNLTGAGSVFLPPISAHVSSGMNLLNLTLYPLISFHIFDTSNLSFNGTQPGPIISVKNGSAVKLLIQNNTTQIFNIAIVDNLYNTSADNVLFDSLSSTISAGGSVSAIFVASKVGTFYYQSMTGSEAKQGEYGYFTVGP